MMSIFINHCWCSKPIWGNGYYDCRIILTIERFAERKDVYARNETPDWQNLIDKIPYSPQTGFSGYASFRLKPEVMEWLKTNVKDRECDEHKQGWAIGTDDYNANNPIQFSIFFERTTDAMKFIKRFSIHKKPVDYFNYFNDIRRKLDLTTNILRKVKRS